MRHLTALGILPFLLFSALPAQAQMITILPEQIGQIFCIGSLGNDMAPVEALLTPDLSVVIADAWAKDAEEESANPGDKPPLGDGVPWRSYPDYADGCAVGAATVGTDQATIDINYSFMTAPEANYTNTLLLKPVVTKDGMEPVWRIDDVDLGEGYTLRQALVDAFTY